MMNIFSKLLALDRRRFWWSIDEDGFDIYINCNDLHRGTSYGLCVYRGIYTENPDIEAVVQEGLAYLEDFLKNHKKDLDLFYEIYTFAALDDFIVVLDNHKRQYRPQYDPMTPSVNPFHGMGFSENH